MVGVAGADAVARGADRLTVRTVKRHVHRLDHQATVVDRKAALQPDAKTREHHDFLCQLRQADRAAGADI
ncbi:hypothetical protein D3C72_1918910 [compost metagenome]